MPKATPRRAPIPAPTSLSAQHLLAAIAAALLLGACGRSQREPLASYQFNAPVGAVTARLAALAAVGSSLSRIDARRPPLRAASSSAGDNGLVTIAIPGGSGQRDVALTVDAPDAAEIDLGPGRFASPNTLSKDFGSALGTLAGRVNNRTHSGDTSRQFARLFDLAAVLDDPALRTRVAHRGRQEGTVDFLFSDQPRGNRFSD